MLSKYVSKHKTKNINKAKLAVHKTLEGYRYLLVGKVLNQTGFD
jgi:hypothetical protein